MKRYLIHFAQNLSLVALAGVFAIYIARLTYPFFYCTYVGPLLDPYVCQGLSFDFGYEIMSWMMLLYCFFAPLFLVALGSSARYWWVAVSFSPILLLMVVGLINGADPTIVISAGIVAIVGLGIAWLVRKALSVLAPGLMTKIS
ncbi:hypothetical protein A3B35_02600 [Candidatus Kaiserbacteria bacterium RIFCSPLOWO2_01_FULL_54_24]|uniref:Uncharacterized protein n=1 Tax=Candidatus Kaiserbacteria bacterium RIFCSPLOWO2_01_FULL_54_24 TaxID=1798515 RepID=A0A1F6EVM9_9BACT|nr:MAG: hypothetical protein A3B35_02600 [Candidatus Kaiserbacteria bacterium RIFCSPLOWO2_01_FULL_54_24]